MLKLIFLKFLNFPEKIPILKEFEWFEWFKWFEWFGPSPIEPESTQAQRGDGRGPGPDGTGRLRRAGYGAKMALASF